MMLLHVQLNEKDLEEISVWVSVTRVKPRWWGICCGLLLCSSLSTSVPAENVWEEKGRRDRLAEKKKTLSELMGGSEGIERTES